MKSLVLLVSLVLLTAFRSFGSGAVISNPVPGTSLAATTVTFSWPVAAVGGQYFFEVGSTGTGSSDIYRSGFIPNATPSQTVGGLSIVDIMYVRLWCETGVGTGLYFINDYVYNVDLDSDGIHDAIDPDPTTTNPKVVVNGADHVFTLLGSGRVASIESSSRFAATNTEMTRVEIQDITQLVYQYLEDAFDFIFVVSNQTTDPASATYSGLFFNAHNDIQGVGLSLFDQTDDYGSAGKLEGAVHLINTRGLIRGPSLHELMHNFGNFFTSVPTAATGHWGTSNVGGQLGGWQSGSLEDLGAGQYRVKNPQTNAYGTFGTNVNGGNSVPYGDLELYAMGLIAAVDVAHDIKIASGFSWVDESAGRFSATGISTVTLNQVLTQDGPRVPGSGFSPKNFRVLYLVLTDTPLTNGDWGSLDEDVVTFSKPANDAEDMYNFFEATGGRATLTMDGLYDTLIRTEIESFDITAAACTLTVDSVTGKITSFSATTT